MAVTWDPQKATANFKKHHVRFGDAEAVLFDSAALTLEDLTAQAERRCVSVGLDVLARILVVVYTYRDDDIRLISARPATPNESTAV